MPIERVEIINLLKRIHLFRGMENPRLETVVDYMEVVEVEPEAVIYQQGDELDSFYFVFSGQLKVSRYAPETRQYHQIGFLEEGDYFGQEVLEENWTRQISVEAESEATLLKMDVPSFRALLDITPVLIPRLQFILDSYHLMLKTRFVWMDPKEFVYYIGRKHILFLFTRILPPIILGIITTSVFGFLTIMSPLNLTTLALLILFAVISLAWLIWNWIDWSNDYYIVTNRRVIYQERVVLLYDSRQESPMSAVQSTSTNTTQTGRILKYGNVAIRTYIGTILFRSVSMPEQVMALIQEQQVRTQANLRRAELRQIENVLERKLGNSSAEPPTPAPSKAGPMPAAPTGIQRFLSDLFHLRYEVGGTVLYRTHWFILLKKIWLPSLLLLALLFWVLLSLFNLFNLISIGAVIGIASILALLIVPWWGYRYVDWHNDIYLITPDQIVDVYRKPLGREERQAAPIKNILSIEYQRLGFLGLVLNFGTVYIRVGDKQLTFDDVYNPSEVQRELFNRLAAKNYAERQAAQEGERQRMADWIAAYHRVAGRNQTPPTPPTRSGF